MESLSRYQARVFQSDKDLEQWINQVADQGYRVAHISSSAAAAGTRYGIDGSRWIWVIVEREPLRGLRTGAH
ncbi:MAG: hypothetical protein DCC63_14780 [Nitrospira sp.]|nr:MAG: hypothetical protein DCC63_14780 [Nitrospira sp.]